MSDSKLPSTEPAASSINLALSADPAIVPASTVIEEPSTAKLPANTELKQKEEQRTELPEETGAGSDINDFLAAKDGLAITPKAVEKKEVKQEEVKKLETKPAEAVKEQVAAKPAKVERDLTGFSDDEQKVLRGMSNEAWSFVSPKLKEHQALAKTLSDKDKLIADLKVGKQMMPESYYEHPNAFTLTPEYNNSLQVLNIASAVQAHWKEQFVRIRQGEKWQDVDINPKTGALVKGAMKEADANSEAEVMEYMNFAAKQVEKNRDNILTMQAGFKEKHNNAVNVLRDAEDKHFAAYKDPNHPYAPVMKTIANGIPEQLRNSPLAGLLVKSSTAVIQLGNLVKELQAKLAAGNGASTAKTASDKRHAGPTEADTQISSSSSQNLTEPEVTYDMFEAAKRE